MLSSVLSFASCLAVHIVLGGLFPSLLGSNVSLMTFFCSMAGRWIAYDDDDFLSPGYTWHYRGVLTGNVFIVLNYEWLLSLS